MENSNQSLINQLLNCAVTCENCASACLDESDVAMMSTCIKLDRDCADVSLLAARLLKRNSVIATQFLVLCEEICRLCAEECSKHDHQHCKDCAKTCHECAEACHQNHTPVTQE